MSKVGLILLSFAVLALIALSAFLKVELGKAEKEAATVQGQLDAARDALRAAEISADKIVAEKEGRIRELEKSEREFSRLTDEIQRLEEDLERERGKTGEQRERADKLSLECEQFRTERDKARQELGNQLTVHEDMLSQLAAAKEAREETARSLSEAAREKEALQVRLTQTAAENAKLTEEVTKLRSLAPELSGNRIMGKVEEKVGSEKIIISELSDTPEVGLELSVFRESEFIARARVYRVFEQYAGARVTFLQKGKDVAAGDVVKTGF